MPARRWLFALCAFAPLLATCVCAQDVPEPPENVPSNQEVAQQVGQAIRDSGLKYNDVQIRYDSGSLELRGVIEKQEDAKRLEEIAAGIPAVKRVYNRVRWTPVPTLFIAGDSTAASGNAGWGNHMDRYFHDTELKVVNRAAGGRSSRTFITGGAWEKLVAEIQPGDWVIIQFGHNDISAVNDATRARGVMPGIGPETQEIDNELTKQKEVVQTFGGYLRKMIADVRAKKAEPILMSPTVRNIWTDGKVERGVGEFGKWAKEVAIAEKTMFVDLTNIVADEYEKHPQDVATLFPRDHTHTSVEGAELNAKWVVSGLKGLREQALIQAMSSGWQVDAVPPTSVVMRTVTQQQFPGGFREWLNLPDVADPLKPTLFIIGDSTARTDRGTGYGPRAQYGWGDPIENFFDRSRINVVNRAVGGTGARTFITSNYWDEIVKRLKPGDVVVMQFGHNDGAGRGALPGVGDNTQEAAARGGGAAETVHSFGWYIQKYIDDTRAKGATPVVCSLIPRNKWVEGKVDRPENTHRQWAQQAAAAKNAPFIDLYELIAQRYDALGREQVNPLFSDGTHTTWAGANVNAECVLAGLKGLPENPVAGYLREPPTAK